MLKRRLASVSSASLPSEYFACMRKNITLARLSRWSSVARDSQPALACGRALSLAAKVLRSEWTFSPVNDLSRIPNEDSIQSQTMYEFSLLPAAAMAYVYADIRPCMLRLGYNMGNGNLPIDLP